MVRIYLLLLKFLKKVKVLDSFTNQFLFLEENSHY